MTKSHKMTFAVVAAMAVALSLAVLPAVTNQALAQKDFSDNPGKGHTKECLNAAEKDISKDDGECPGGAEGAGPIEEQKRAGKSHVVKDSE